MYRGDDPLGAYRPKVGKSRRKSKANQCRHGLALSEKIAVRCEFVEGHRGKHNAPSPFLGRFKWTSGDRRGFVYEGTEPE